MSNIIDYPSWRGDIHFNVSPWNEVDGALCATLSYLNFHGLEDHRGVTLRYFGGAAPIWTEELARFSMVWMVLIGAAAAFYTGDQMSIDFVVMKLPPRGKAFCRVLSVAVRFIVLAALIWFGARNVIGSWKMKTMALGVPKSIPLMAVPIGMGLLLATILFKAAARKEGERK